MPNSSRRDKSLNIDIAYIFHILVNEPPMVPPLWFDRTESSPQHTEECTLASQIPVVFFRLSEVTSVCVSKYQKRKEIL